MTMFEVFCKVSRDSQAVIVCDECTFFENWVADGVNIIAHDADDDCVCEYCGETEQGAPA